MKKVKIILPFIIFLVVLIGLGALAYFLPSNDAQSGKLDSGYEIEQYAISVQINTDNTYNVQEIIAVQFKGLRHGIYRYIPTLHTMTINENNKSKKVTQNIDIYDVTCSTQSVSYYENKNYVLQMGDENHYQPLDTIITYEINYSLNLGEDYADTFDYVYFNLLGTNWGTTIADFAFNVYFPKEIEEDNLNLYFGQYGVTTALNSAMFTTTNQSVSGRIYNVEPFEGVTLNIDLPSNYFENVTEIISPFYYILLVGSIVVAITAVVLFLLRKRKYPLIAPVEFYAPDNLNPADIAIILNGRVTAKQMTSMIVYFASKKYLKIVVEDDKNIMLIKKKDIDENAKKYEKNLFNKLFENGNSANFEDLISKKSIPGKFDTLAGTLYQATTLAYIHRPVKKRFETRNAIFGGIQIGLSLLLFALSMFVFTFTESSGIVLKIIYLSAIVVAIGISVYVVYKYNYLKDTYVSNSGLIFMMVCALLLVLSFHLLILNQCVTLGYLQFVIPLAVIIGMILSMFTVSYSDSQTKILGKVVGFRNFLLTCEKPRIEMLLKDNPAYFYDVLPYAYMFGITDEFINRFEKLGVNLNYVENDYFSYGVMNQLIFMNILNSQFYSLSRSANQIMISNTKGGGSIGGGFGGFSGGGFGGGGGGSW